ncbi:hypothetical protein TURU_122222 [Turdus rufiventris]|nr:hypothetical protein TURU_122222 [Turdus rufiventris]
MEIHSGVDIHPQPMDSHMPGGVGGCRLKEVAACGQTMLEQTGSWQDCELLVLVVGSTGDASVSNCQKLTPGLAEPMTAGSRTGPLLAKAKPIREGIAEGSDRMALVGTWHPAGSTHHKVNAWDMFT